MISAEVLIFIIGLLVTGVAVVAVYSVGQIDVPYDSSTGPAAKQKAE